MEKQNNSSNRLILSVLASVMCSILIGLCLMINDVIESPISENYSTAKNNIFRNSNIILFASALISNILISKLSIEKTKLLAISYFLYAYGFVLYIYGNLGLAYIYIGRLFQGFAMGIVGNSIPSYLSAISPVNLRGTISSLYSLGVLLGIIIGSALALIKEQYKIILLAISTLSILFSFIAGMSIKMAPSASSATSSLLSIFKNTNARKSLLIIAISHIAQNVSGISHIIFNAHTIFVGTNPKKMQIYLFLFAFLVSLFSSSVLDKFGRKPMLILSSSIVASSCLAFYFAWYSQVFAFIYILGYNSGLNSIPFILIGEIFPAEAIPLGSLFGISCNFTGTILSLLVPSGGTEMYNKAFLFYFISLLTYIGSMAVLYNETKGKIPAYQ